MDDVTACSRNLSRALPLKHSKEGCLDRQSL